MNKEEKDTRYLSGTVLKAAEVLRLVSGRGMTAAEIGRELDMEKTTVHRLLDTLEHVGFVDRTMDKRHYHIGKALSEMCARPMDFPKLRKYANSVVPRLTELFKRAVTFSVPYSGQVLYLCTSTTGGVVEYSDRAVMAPMHCTACGKAMLMYRDEEDVRRLLAKNGMEKRTRYTITDPDRYIEELHLARKAGYAVGNREFRLRYQRVAVPVLDEENHVIAVLSTETETPTGYGELSIDTAWVIGVLKQEAAVLSYKISEGEL